MAKQKRVKKYVPRAVSFAAMNAVLTNQHGLDASQQEELTGRARSALRCLLVDAAPTVEPIDDLYIAIEMAARLTDTAVGGSDYVVGLEDALACLLICKARHGLTGCFRLFGDEIRAIEMALDLHDALIAVTSCGAIREAIGFLRGHEYRPNMGRAA